MPILSGLPRIIHNLTMLDFPLVDKVNEMILTPCEMRFSTMRWLFEKYDNDWGMAELDKAKMANFAFILGILPANDVPTIEGSFIDAQKQITFFENLTDMVVASKKCDSDGQVDERCAKDIFFLESIAFERNKIFSTTPFKSSLVSHPIPSSVPPPDFKKLQQTLDNLIQSISSLQNHYIEIEKKLKQKGADNLSEAFDFSKLEDSEWLRSKDEKIALFKTTIDRFNLFYSNEIQHWSSKTSISVIPIDPPITSITQSCEYLKKLFDSIFDLQNSHQNILKANSKITKEKSGLLDEGLVFDIREKVVTLQSTVDRLKSI